MMAAAALVAGACDRSSSGPEPDGRRTPAESPTGAQTQVIGLVGTGTGRYGWRADEAFEGADVAVSVLNRNRSEGERRFELVARDDGGNPAAAADLVAELAALPRTAGIVYAGPPEGLVRAQDALAGAGIPAILCYGDLYGSRDLTRNIFQASPSLLWEARRLARYLLRDRDYERIGAVVERTPTGRVARSALAAAAARYGARRPVIATMAPGAVGVRRALDRLRRERVEAIVIQGTPASAGAVAQYLDRTGAGYRTTSSARIASASRRVAAQRRRSGWWHPQLAGFDSIISRTSLPRGTVASDSYARGVHYLPVPSFERFDRAFRAWWGEPPMGRQVRAYDAAAMIGWAARNARAGEDVAAALERLRGRRFGSLGVTFGPDDHTAVDEATVGLWAVPSVRADVPERARLDAFPWAPLARGFAIDGRTLDIPSRDWRYLVRRAPPPDAPAPRFDRLRFGIRSGRSDPVH